MAYGFQKHESLEHGVRRIAREELETALRGLRSRRASRSALPPADAIHSARKALKKNRALLRLVRAQLGEPVFEREINACREAGRLLSSARDADVRLATFDKIAGRDPSLAPVRALLLAEARGDHGGALNRESLRALLATLEAAGARLAVLEIPADRWRTLRCGLESTLRRTRKSFCHALEHADLEALHDCRKRFKDFHYQLSLLRALEEPTVQDMRRRTKTMGDLLGEDRDLASLAAHLRGLPVSEKIDAAFIASLLGRVEKRRHHLLARIHKLGRKVEDLKAGAFLKPLARAWKTWRKAEPPVQGA